MLTASALSFRNCSVQRETPRAICPQGIQPSAGIWSQFSSNYIIITTVLISLCYARHFTYSAVLWPPNMGLLYGVQCLLHIMQPFVTLAEAQGSWCMGRGLAQHPAPAAHVVLLFSTRHCLQESST